MDDWDKSWLGDECPLCHRQNGECKTRGAQCEFTDGIYGQAGQILAKLEEIETQQGESYEETEIVSQSWLQEQTKLLKFHESICDSLTYMTTQLIEGRVELTQEIDQFGSDIHDLEAHLNKKIEACLKPNYQLSWMMTN
ncbi:hypothetical protein H5410_026690 [Solanum commersonii]|uniref:Uncharacterized protein n=1 Tax=Solanum commersonii TaxID=4109 RepID=A0A9J5Z287_SOLCO|nr:hypothetical protein H5410_026690 [Solanum commersonii]